MLLCAAPSLAFVAFVLVFKVKSLYAYKALGRLGGSLLARHTGMEGAEAFNWVLLIMPPHCISVCVDSLHDLLPMHAFCIFLGGSLLARRLLSHRHGGH